MGFTSRRGRPKAVIQTKSRGEKDLGTKELQARRAKGLTAEPIDICRDKALVNADQYSAALHFRWLYTVRFGAPGVSAINLDMQFGRSNGENDEKWQAEREREYSMAVEKLRSRGALRIVMNIAVFNHLPRFLRSSGVHSKGGLRQNVEDLAKFRDGLDNLGRIFNRSKGSAAGATLEQSPNN